MEQIVGPGEQSDVLRREVAYDVGPGVQHHGTHRQREALGEDGIGGQKLIGGDEFTALKSGVAPAGALIAPQVRFGIKELGAVLLLPSLLADSAAVR